MRNKNSISLFHPLNLYKVLLFLYPRNYRKEYSDQMIILFKDLTRDYHAQHGGLDTKFWLQIVLDVCKSAAYQYLSGISLLLFRSIVSTLTVVAATFLTVYLIISALFWIYSSFTFNGTIAVKQRLHTFVEKYKPEITTDIFSTVYTQAEYCLRLTDEKLLSACRKNVGTTLGNILHEEELADKFGYYWPNDLFFVKSSGDMYYRVGWDGEFKNITSSINAISLKNGSSLYSLLFKKNCNAFHAVEGLPSCDVFEKVSLQNGDTGYVVRMSPFQEEDDLSVVMIMPFFGLFWMFSGPMTNLSSEQLYFFLFISSSFIIPLFVSSTVMYYLKKKKHTVKPVVTTIAGIIVVGFVIFFGWFIWYWFFRDQTPQFFPINEPNGDYRIIKEPYFQVQYTGPKTLEITPNGIGSVTVMVGESTVDLSQYIGKKVILTKGKFYSGFTTQCILRKCVDIGGPYAAVIIEGIKEIPNALPRSEILNYVVQPEDSIDTIAKKFSISAETILWANTIGKNGIHPGDSLKILPVTGVLHYIKDGETVESIADLYHTDPKNIVDFPFNGLNYKSEYLLITGNHLIIPNGVKE